MNMRFNSLFPAFWLMLLPVSAIAVAEQTPTEIVEATAQEILKAMNGKREHYRQNPDELYGLVDQLLVPRFDRVYAARLVLGKHWRAASKTQRQRFIDGFYRSLLRQYAEGLLEFTADTMTILPSRGEDDESKATVRTVVKLEDGTEVPVHYRMRRTDRGWKVWDVVVEGISYVKNYRTDFDSEINAKGLDAVLARLESKDGDQGKAAPTPAKKKAL